MNASVEKNLQKTPLHQENLVREVDQNYELDQNDLDMIVGGATTCTYKFRWNGRLKSATCTTI